MNQSQNAEINEKINDRLLFLGDERGWRQNEAKPSYLRQKDTKRVCSNRLYMYFKY